MTWSKDSRKWAIHYKIDCTDVKKGKNDAMMLYFNHHSSLVDYIFFGTPMSITPMFTPFLDNKAKLKYSKHTKKQGILGSSLKSITLGGLYFFNWSDTNMENTLQK